MGMKIPGHRVLIRHDKPKERFETKIPEGLKNTGFQVAMSQDQERREEAATEVGTVIQVGKTCWHAYDRYLKDGTINPDWEPWCKVGDRVLFPKYQGKFVEDPVTGEKFMLVNDEDIQVVVTGVNRDVFQGELA